MNATEKKATFMSPWGDRDSYLTGLPLAREYQWLSPIDDQCARRFPEDGHVLPINVARASPSVRRRLGRVLAVRVPGLVEELRRGMA